MASRTIQNPKHNKRRSSKSCFLACFGVSQKVKESGKVEPSVYNNNNNKEGVGLLSWSKVVMKNINKSGSKTVPIDHHHHTTEESDADHHHQQSGHNMNNSIHTTNAKSSKMKWLNYKLLKKRDQKIQNGTISNKTKPFDHQTPKVAKLFSKDQELQAPKEMLEHVTRDVGPEQNSDVQNLKSNDHVADSSKEDTCTQKQLLIKTTRRSLTGLSQTQLGSPKPNRASKLAHAVSMPPPSLNVDSPSRSLAKTKTTRQNNNATARRLDPLVGMSVLMVILIIMLVWGRFCAVVCTSAWLYFVARLRTQSTSGDDKNSGEVDLNSEEYKKKVVLEGLLERNHRASTL